MSSTVSHYLVVRRSVQVVRKEMVTGEASLWSEMLGSRGIGAGQVGAQASVGLAQANETDLSHNYATFYLFFGMDRCGNEHLRTRRVP